MNIDKNAPMTARQEIIINAPVQKVWAVQTDLANWPRWQPDISTIALDGPLAAGMIFRWKAKGLSITSTIVELESERRITWTGKSVGTGAIHIWIFEPQGDQTRVITEESLSGWFPRIIKVFMPGFLDKGLQDALALLKAESERA